MRHLGSRTCRAEVRKEEGNEIGAQVWRAFRMVLPSSELRTPESGQEEVQSALSACELPGGHVMGVAQGQLRPQVGGRSLEEEGLGYRRHPWTCEWGVMWVGCHQGRFLN